MSVSHTADAVIERRKTVTRRLGWRMLKAGDHLTLCRKVMGRKPGEPLERLAEVEVLSVRREALSAISFADVRAEAVPGHEHEFPIWWVRWFSQTFGIRYDAEITRIEWRYL